MFAKSRGSSTAPCDLLPDPIRNTYEIGKQSATAGPENVWRIYDGYRKKDRMVISQTITLASFLSLFLLPFLSDSFPIVSRLSWLRVILINGLASDRFLSTSISSDCELVSYFSNSAGSNHISG